MTRAEKIEEALRQLTEDLKQDAWWADHPFTVRARAALAAPVEAHGDEWSKPSPDGFRARIVREPRPEIPCNVESSVGHHCVLVRGHDKLHRDKHGNPWSGGEPPPVTVEGLYASYRGEPPPEMCARCADAGFVRSPRSDGLGTEPVPCPACRHATA